MSTPPRTTPEEVKAVLAPGRDYRAGVPLEPFIRAANKIVNQIQSSAASYGRTPMDDVPDTLDAPSTARIVETWLAAWAYKISDQQYKSSVAGRSSATFRGQEGKGFELNNYGAAAMQFDSTGILQAVNESRIAGVSWLGKAFFDQLSWDMRNLGGNL